MRAPIIGICGHPGAGKNTVGEILHAADETWVLMAFADPLKEIVGEVYDFSHDQLWGPSHLRDVPDKRYSKGDGTFMTPREPLKAVGTAARACFPETWASKALRNARAAISTQGCRVVFTDCRFLNEAKPILAEGGQIWRIYRPESDDGKVFDHPSELEIDTPEFKKLVTHTIHNDGTLKELEMMVQQELEMMVPRRKFSRTRK